MLADVCVIMNVGTLIGGDLDRVVRAAQRGDELGYDYAGCGKMSHDSMLTMCVAATATEYIELQTSVTIAFPRAPMMFFAV